MTQRSSPLIQNVGVGLRSEHVQHVLTNQPKVSWFELLIDNWMVPGGLLRAQFEAIVESYPVTFHGVSLSLGGSHEIDFNYLKQVKELKNAAGAAWYSEHVAFTRHNGIEFHDLCPLPGTDEAVQHLGSRIQEVQDYLGEQILIENVSSYIRFDESYLSEGEFLAELSTYADCLLLVDINNFYINQFNHGMDAVTEMKKLPASRITELHLAGAKELDGFIVDTHSHPVQDEVWELFQEMISVWGPKPTLIEWDNNIPPWEILYREYLKAAKLCEQSVNK